MHQSSTPSVPSIVARVLLADIAEATNRLATPAQRRKAAARSLRLASVVIARGV